MIRELNRSGLTAFGSAGCEAGSARSAIGSWADQGQLDVRVFCITAPGRAAATSSSSCRGSRR